MTRQSGNGSWPRRSWPWSGTFPPPGDHGWSSILQYTIRTVLHAIPDATLADVEQMLTDADYREGVLEKTTDPRLLQFWQTQFRFFPKNATDPVLNKLSVFLLDRNVRNIVCQRRAAINFDRLLNEGKILLANLSIGPVDGEGRWHIR